MTQESIGIDTSSLVRLVTGEPPDMQDHCLDHLRERGSKSVMVMVPNRLLGRLSSALRLTAARWSGSGDNDLAEYTGQHGFR